MERGAASALCDVCGGPPSSTKGGPRKQTTPGTQDDTLAAKHPWINRIIGKQAADVAKKKQAVDFPPVEAPDDEEVKAVFAAVEAAREDLAAEDETGDDFTILARGGPSTMAAHGVAVDSYRAAAQNGTPSEWIKLFSVQGFAQLLLASSAMARAAACCYVKFGAV